MSSSPYPGRGEIAQAGVFGFPVNIMDDRGTSIYQSIDGGQALLDWFGRVPSFQDAEVLSLNLDRAGPSRLTLHGWNMTDRVDAEGFYIEEKHAVVTFTLEDLADLQLEDFNHQNVIDGLNLSRGPTNPLYAHPRAEAYKILLEPCFGLSGFICAGKVSVSFVPGKP